MDEEKKKEFDTRKEKFMAAYKVARDECMIDIAFIPQYIPDGKGFFTTMVHQTLVDLTTAPTPSNPSDFL